MPEFLDNACLVGGIEGAGGQGFALRFFGPTASKLVPLNDHEVVAQIYGAVYGGVPRIAALDIGSGAHRDLLTADTITNPVAGGGHWSIVTTTAVYLDGRILHPHVQGQPHPIAFSTDGTLAACRHLDLGGLFLLNLLNGERTDLEPIPVFAEDVRFPYDHGLIWRVGQGPGCLRANAGGLPPRADPIRGDEGCNFPVATVLHGQWWRANHSGGRIIVYPAGETRGYSIPVQPNEGYGLDMRPAPWDAKVLQLAWAKNAGEQFPSLVYTVVDTTKPRVSLI